MCNFTIINPFCNSAFFSLYILITLFLIIQDAIDIEESKNIINETITDYNDEKTEKGEEEVPKVIIDPNLVQIRATPDELKHRILSFIERKRQQVNIVNVQEFCSHRLVKETFTKE